MSVARVIGTAELFSEPNLKRMEDSPLFFSMVAMTRGCHLVYVAVLALMVPAADSQTVVGPPSNPFLNPKNDPYNPLRYIASNTLTAVAFGN